MCLGIVGLDTDRLLIIGDGFQEPALPCEDDAEIVEGLGMVGPQPDRCAD